MHKFLSLPLLTYLDPDREATRADQVHKADPNLRVLKGQLSPLNVPDGNNLWVERMILQEVQPVHLGRPHGRGLALHPALPALGTRQDQPVQGVHIRLGVKAAQQEEQAV